LGLYTCFFGVLTIADFMGLGESVPIFSLICIVFDLIGIMLIRGVERKENLLMNLRNTFPHFQ